MKRKWGKHIGGLALAVLAGTAMLSTKGITAKAVDNEWTYDYTGYVQTFTVPHDGNYRLEVWGAQGGTASACNGVTASGGKGGYSVGCIQLKKGDKLYIAVGGRGADSGTKAVDGYISGGYNGGGAAGEGWSPSYASGGGATHIALNSDRGVLANYVNNRNEILIVAGGGAGAMADDNWNYTGEHEDSTNYNTTTGGDGGGLTGGKAIYDWWCDCHDDTGHFFTSTAVPTQDSGNAFGQGGSTDCTGGGGGWYGGYGSWLWCGGSTGGSGYIGGVSDGSMQTGVKSDYGYAKITALHVHNYTSQVTTNPTCENDGVRTYTCIGTATDPGCGDQYTESIPALNHDCSVVIPLGTEGYEVSGRPGYFYTRKCSRCGLHYCREELGQFLQQTFVKYMDTNGNYPAGDNTWQLADSKQVIYGQYYSWSYADRQEFKGNSVYYQVTKANNNYIYIERKKYQQQVTVYYQNADGLGDADATFTPITEVSDDYFYGSQVTWNYTPRVEYNDTVTSSRRDGTVQTSLTYTVTDRRVTEFWAFRKLVTLDINGEYLWKASIDASDESGTKYKYPDLGYSATDANNNMGTFDIYINGKLDIQKGHNVRDYYRTDILYGSKWEVENIESDAGKHYYGADIN